MQANIICPQTSRPFSCMHQKDLSVWSEPDNNIIIIVINNMAIMHSSMESLHIAHTDMYAFNMAMFDSLCHGTLHIIHGLFFLTSYS